MAPSTSQSSSGTPPTQSTPMVAKKFIGAVEDHWELFRCERYHSESRSSAK